MWGNCAVGGAHHNGSLGIQLLIALALCTGALRAQNCVAPPPGLVSWWPGNGDANDVVGGNNGTLQGGVTFVPGKVGQAFSFDGVNDYVSFGNTAGNFGTSDFTIEFWIRTTASHSSDSILEKWPTCGPSSKFNI